MLVRYYVVHEQSLKLPLVLAINKKRGLLRFEKKQQARTAVRNVALKRKNKIQENAINSFKEEIQKQIDLMMDCKFLLENAKPVQCRKNINASLNHLQKLREKLNG